MAETDHCDILVVGGGTAAFEAAVSARYHGAGRVILLEKASEAQYGGNARYSGTGFRFVHSGKDEIGGFVPDVDPDRWRKAEIGAYTPDHFRGDLDRVTRGRIDPGLADTLVQTSNRAVHWMHEVGIRWELGGGGGGGSREIDGRIHFHPGQVIHPVGGGTGQLEQWRAIATNLGIEVRFENRVIGIHGDDRRVTGVRVRNPEAQYDVAAGAVILCSGGFQANAELRARYLGPGSDVMKVRGSRHNTGEVLFMALGLGAKASGHWQGAHASPIDRASPDVEADPAKEIGFGGKGNRYAYPWGITVNALGERFFDEGEAESAYTYAKTGWAVQSQPGSVAFQLFDQKNVRMGHLSSYKEATLVVAPTLDDLAQALSIAPAALRKTVEEYNAAIQEDISYVQTQRDGRCTVGLKPDKSNWAIRLDEPPFIAQPVTGGITFSFGGLEINTEAQVMNTSLEPIAGLYASGDILGLFYYNYPSYSGQCRNAVFSMLAGAHAARTLPG